MRLGVSLHLAVVEDSHVERGYYGLEVLVTITDSVDTGDFGDTIVNDRGGRLGRLEDPRNDAGVTLQMTGEV